MRFVKYFVIVGLCGAGVGYAVYRYLPTWVFVLFVLTNLLGWAVVRGAPRRSGGDEDEQ